MASGPVTVGSTYKWTATFLKDSAIYNLTGATPTISFQSPAGLVTTFSMTAILATAGTAVYTNATTLFTAAGQWKRSYKVTLSGVVLESFPIIFTVYPSVSGS